MKFCRRDSSSLRAGMEAHAKTPSGRRSGTLGDPTPTRGAESRPSPLFRQRRCDATRDRLQACTRDKTELGRVREGRAIWASCRRSLPVALSRRTPLAARPSPPPSKPACPNALARPVPRLSTGPQLVHHPANEVVRRGLLWVSSRTVAPQRRGTAGTSSQEVGPAAHPPSRLAPRALRAGAGGGR
jgi:hypothetical protein